MMKQWFKSGQPWVWLSAAAVSASLLLVFGLLALIFYRGLGFFWPADIHEIRYQLADSSTQRVYLGEIFDQETVDSARVRAGGIPIPQGQPLVTRYLLKTGNKEISNQDFAWVVENYITSNTLPDNVATIERREWGNFYGVVTAVKQGDVTVATGPDAWNALQRRIGRVNDIYEQINEIEDDYIGDINTAMEALRLEKRRLELNNEWTPETEQRLVQRKARLQKSYNEYEQQLRDLYKQVNRDTAMVRIASGKEVAVPLANIVRAFQPNTMSALGKSWHYVKKVWEFLSEEPREANTEGGIFPAIFGTISMVLIMSVLVTPLGVIAAVYLKEYAKQGLLTRTIRIAVNNLAGVPSIVYGVFGLGFFVYFIGGHIDNLFFPAALPAPTFGTPGLLWASLTLALLTLPVVIVATEEGLTRIPRSVREASFALGATKAETLWRIVLPMASPALMTGVILAVARAAGEVAPLMLVGVVKLAPSLPIDGDFPYLHLERKIMHLGFHIYDVGLQSPNVEAARPLVYATALLLVLVIVVLNLAAIAVRNHLREKYRGVES